MKKEAVGEITRSGGFSRLIRDVEESGEPVIIMKSNSSVAILLPCPEGMEAYMRDSMAIVRAFVDLLQEERNVEGLEFLLRQSAIGDFAKIYLMGIGVDSTDIRSASEDIHSNIARVAREYATKLPTKSPAQDKALSSHDNLSGVVPKVKQEGLPIDGSPSVSRKRGRPRKTEVSPL